MADWHVGEAPKAVLTMRDVGGAITRDYDDVAGIQWSSTDPNVAEVTDPDADPFDAVVEMKELGSCRVEVAFDGRKGPDENRITAGADINVVPGEAVSGELTLELVVVPPPAE